MKNEEKFSREIEELKDKISRDDLIKLGRVRVRPSGRTISQRVQCFKTFRSFSNNPTYIQVLLHEVGNSFVR